MHVHGYHTTKDFQMRHIPTYIQDGFCENTYYLTLVCANKLLLHLQTPNVSGFQHIT